MALKTNGNYRRSWVGTFARASRSALGGVLLVVALPSIAGTSLMYVLDDSGSLSSTDSAGLRYAAVRDLTSKLSTNADIEKIGLSYFIFTSNIAVPLQPATSAVSAINAATSGPSGGARPSTGAVEYYAAGIKGAADEFAKSAAASSSKVMVLFSDGGTQYGSSDPVAAARAAKAQGITVNVVVLGSPGAATPQILKDIAEAGGGKVISVANATDLSAGFGQAVDVRITSVPEIIKQQVMPQIQRATSVQQASIISNVLSNIFSARAPNAPGAPARVSLNGERGMASGNEIGGMNAWVNAAETKIGNQTLASMFSGKVTNAIGGVDYTVSQELVAGVSLGHDRVSLDLNFVGPDSRLVSTGWMIAPYVGYQINENLSADAALGYASGDVDTRDSAGSRSETYSRNFLALNLTSTHWMDDIQILAKVNYIAANEKVGTTNKMEQLRLSGQVGYWMDGIMPYASVTYVRDLKISTGGIQPVGPDKEAWTVAIGANLFSKGAMYGGASLSKEYGRNDSRNQVFMANLGYRF